MNLNGLILKALSCIILFFCTSCATPVAPTGGEPDKTGPKLISSYPENGSINFSGNEVQFTFDDYVNRNSFRSSLSIEPGINLDYDLRWRRKTAILRFNEPLPDSTTIIFTITSELRDLRNNRLSVPITLGLSTGSEIDKGEVKLHVVGLYPSVNLNEVSVLLYRSSFDLSNPANYLGIPDTSGVIHFRYLGEGSYSGILLHDINRNRIWESNREFAQPLPVETFELKAEESLDLGKIYYARSDTSRPELQGVGLLSNNRLRLRFSRPIRYAPNQGIQLIRTQDGRIIEANYLYNDDSNESVSFFQTTEVLDGEFNYRIDLGMLTDNNGNLIRSSLIEFEGSDVNDTTLVRYIRNISEVGLRPTDPLLLMYSSVITDQTITDSLKIYVNRSLSETAVSIQIEDNLLKISPQNRWIEANDYDIRAWNPAIARHVTVQPRIIREADLGEIEVTIADSALTEFPMRLILYNERNQQIHNIQFTSKVKIQSIRSGTYRLIVFHDISNNGVWDYGSIIPYRNPKLIYVDKKLPIRSRMTSNVEVIF
jgi:hypothetical protein